MSRRKAVRILFAGTLVVLALCVLAAFAGMFLVIDRPQHSDVLLVLDGPPNDVRFESALKLLRSGYAADLILDAPDLIHYGRRVPEYAEEYVRAVAPDRAGHVHVCAFRGDSTFKELRYDVRCLQQFAPSAKSVMIVTSSSHTRRALSTARRVLPQYQWSVAAAADEHESGIFWWRNRTCAKETVDEWERLIWWELVDRWRTFR